MIYKDSSTWTIRATYCPIKNCPSCPTSLLENLLIKLNPDKTSEVVYQRIYRFYNSLIMSYAAEAFQNCTNVCQIVFKFRRTRVDLGIQVVESKSWILGSGFDAKNEVNDIPFGYLWSTDFIWFKPIPKQRIASVNLYMKLYQNIKTFFIFSKFCFCFLASKNLIIPFYDDKGTDMKNWQTVLMS